MLDSIASAISPYLLHVLCKTEDFDSLFNTLQQDMRSLALRSAIQAIEAFDTKLKAEVSRDWSAHEYAPRTLITLLGELTFKRTIYKDKYGRRRALADEILGIPPRVRLSSDAFLWIAEKASEISYRKTAKQFRELTGVAISHITVMNVVHKEGALLRDAEGEFEQVGSKISQETLFLESDGLWVHLQESEHRKEALSRFLYEQAKTTKSYELKIAALYAGKKKVAKGRYKRLGLCLTCSNGSPDVFWQRVFNMISQNYEIEDLKRLAVGGDGAEWCGKERIESMVPMDIKVDFTLDFFHVMKKITQAFAEGSAKRDWAVNLAVRGKGMQLAKMCDRITKKMKSGKAKDKVLDLGKYAKQNARSIVKPRRELGTMEGTNAHIGAARLKGHGRSWSKQGAEAMCLIRCALATGRGLIPAAKLVFFTEKEKKKAQEALANMKINLKERDGHGYDYPIKAFSSSLPTNAAFRAATC